MTLKEKIAPLFSRQFIKYCLVGFSGIFVNLGALYLLADLLALHLNLASALAIEFSILSNFVLNERWTFTADQRRGTLAARLARFHGVTAVGGLMQWACFIVLNLALFALFSGEAERASYWSAWAEGSLVSHPVTHPPAVGAWKYLSQLGGVAVATFWNFLANYYWTWRRNP